jgi:hypothetical protein
MATIAGNPVTFTTADEPFSAGGEPTDPTTVVAVWSVKDADGNLVASGQYAYLVNNELVRDNTGVYHVTFDTTAWGGCILEVLFASEGVCQARASTYEQILASDLTPVFT